MQCGTLQQLSSGEPRELWCRTLIFSDGLSKNAHVRSLLQTAHPFHQSLRFVDLSGLFELVFLFIGDLLQGVRQISLQLWHNLGCITGWVTEVSVQGIVPNLV